MWTTHDRAYCEMWRDEINKQETREMIQQYVKWLVDTGRVQNGRPMDNMRNKALFVNWFEKREAFAKRRASSGGNSSGS
jgi:hypothetical protein